MSDFVKRYVLRRRADQTTIRCGAALPEGPKSAHFKFGDIQRFIPRQLWVVEVNDTSVLESRENYYPSRLNPEALLPIDESQF
jgi:hypothetical protein